MVQKSAGNIKSSDADKSDNSETKLIEKLLKEIDALKLALEKAQKAASENSQYRAFVENRVNKKAKDRRIPYSSICSHTLSIKCSFIENYSQMIRQ